MQTTFVCACCGRLRPRSERVTVGADALCWSCSEEHTTLCDRCGERMYRRQGFRHNGRTLCAACLEQVNHD